jgi:hypothetical protein
MFQLEREDGSHTALRKGRSQELEETAGQQEWPKDQHGRQLNKGRHAEVGEAEAQQEHAEDQEPFSASTVRGDLRHE